MADPGSGVRTPIALPIAQLEARYDSGAMPPGVYVFSQDYTQN